MNSQSQRHRQPASTAFGVCVFVLLFPWALIQANPSGELVVSGNANFHRAANTLTIQQTTDRAIVHWDDFSIASGHTTQINQPTNQSALLNRVTSGNPSSLMGNLHANGKVYLVNPNGILVGAGANIDTGSFIASTQDVSNADFMNGGDLTFTGNSTARIVNEGAIIAREGDLILIAREVENQGSLEAPQGLVGLAAATEVLISDTQDGQRIYIKAGEGQIVNAGLINSARAELRAAGGNPYALAINQTGTVRATGVSEHNGQVWLVAEQGKTRIDGLVEASRGERGGDIRALGDTVLLDQNAHLKAIGNQGGGNIMVGGDYLGSNPDIKNAQKTLVAPNARVDASALLNGDGGRVILWADDLTNFWGTVNVRGGELSGNGGFTEVSGKETLIFRGSVDNSAANGNYGVLLLDPDSILIKNGSGASTGVQADWALEAGGNFTIYETDLEALTGIVTLRARRDILIEDLADNELTLSATEFYFYSNDESSLTQQGGIWMMDLNDTIYLKSGAGGVLHLQGGRYSDAFGGLTDNIESLHLGNLKTDGANVEIFTKRSQPALPIHIHGTIESNGGNVTIDRSTRGGVNSPVVDVTLHSMVNTGGGNFTSQMTGVVNVNGGMNLGAGTATFGGTQTSINSVITSTNNVNVTAPLIFGAGSGITTSGKVTFTNTASMAAGGSLTLTANDFEFQQNFTGNNATITLRPYNASTHVDVGIAGTPAADMLINAANLARLNGFANVIIGRNDGTGTTSVNQDTTFSASTKFEIINNTINITGGKIENTTGAVVLTGNIINITKPVIAGTQVSIQTLTAGTPIDIGADITAAELAQITSPGGLIIGDVDSGTITVSQAVTLTTMLHIKSGAGIQATAAPIDVPNLALTAGGAINLSHTNNKFTNLAVNAPNQTATIVNSQGLDIGTVDGVNGITAGTLNLTAQGNVTDTQPVQVGTLAVNITGSLTLDHANTQIATLNTINQVGALNIKDTSGDLEITGTINNNANPIKIETPGNLTLAAGSKISTTGNGNDIILSAVGNFINNQGSDVLSTSGGGRFVIYSNNPANNTFGGLASGQLPIWGQDITTRAPGTTTGNQYVFKINPTITFTPTDATKVYGNVLALTLYTSFSPTTHTYGGAYLAETDLVINGTPVLSSLGTPATANAANYTIDIAQGSIANNKGYVMDFTAKGTLTVTARPLTVSVASGQTKLFSTADPLSFTYALGGSGLVNGDTINGSLSRIAGENAGTYAITQNTLSAGGNYSINYVGADFTISPRLIIVSANTGQVKTYGNADPILGYSISGGDGLIGGDALSGNLSRTSGEKVGSYAINLGTLNLNSNYTLSLLGSQFIINPADLFISVNSSSRSLFSPNPTFTATAQGLKFTDTLESLGISLNSDATLNSPAGNYAISASGSSDNYNITFNAGTLTITKIETSGFDLIVDVNETVTLIRTQEGTNQGGMAIAEFTKQRPPTIWPPYDFPVRTVEVGQDTSPSTHLVIQDHAESDENIYDVTSENFVHDNFKVLFRDRGNGFKTAFEDSGKNKEIEILAKSSYQEFLALEKEISGDSLLSGNIQ